MKTTWVVGQFEIYKDAMETDLKSEASINWPAR
jgi:hypothetical protein